MESQKDETVERVVTSAISGKSIAEIRECLKIVRSFLTHNTPRNPIYLHYEVLPGVTMERFAFQLTKGHHMKRHQKSKLCRKEKKNSEPLRNAPKENTLNTFSTHIIPNVSNVSNQENKQENKKSSDVAFENAPEKRKSSVLIGKEEKGEDKKFQKISNEITTRQNIKTKNGGDGKNETIHSNKNNDDKINDNNKKLNATVENNVNANVNVNANANININPIIPESKIQSDAKQKISNDNSENPQQLSILKHKKSNTLTNILSLNQPKDKKNTKDAKNKKKQSSQSPKQ